MAIPPASGGGSPLGPQKIHSQKELQALGKEIQTLIQEIGKWIAEFKVYESGEGPAPSPSFAKIFDKVQDLCNKADTAFFGRTPENLPLQGIEDEINYINQVSGYNNPPGSGMDGPAKIKAFEILSSHLTDLQKAIGYW